MREEQPLPRFILGLPACTTSGNMSSLLVAALGGLGDKPVDQDACFNDGAHVPLVPVNNIRCQVEVS